MAAIFLEFEVTAQCLLLRLWQRCNSSEDFRLTDPLPNRALGALGHTHGRNLRNLIIPPIAPRIFPAGRFLSRVSSPFCNCLFSAT